jgi:nucleoside phosphorylase
MPKTRNTDIGNASSTFESLQSIIDLLIVTATIVELETSLESLEPLPNEDNVIKCQKGNLTYYIGVLGIYPVALFRCSMMGSLKRDASFAATLEAIDIWKPKACIMVGIAFGKDASKQKIGDILISETLSQYETVKEEKDTLTRGHSVPCSPLLLNRFTQTGEWSSSRKKDKCKIIQCEIVSGEKLINDNSVKTILFDRFPNAQGGEMEGNGFYAANAKNKIDWIIVKAICDWADGNKNDEWHKIAANNSVEYAKYILSIENTLEEIGIRSIKNKEILKKMRYHEVDYKDIHGYEIVKIIYPKHTVSEVTKEKDTKKRIYYEYIEVKVTGKITIGYLFLANPNNISQIQTINHFYKNYSGRYSSLFVCSPKVRSEKTGKDDYRLKNIKDRFYEISSKSDIKNTEFFYTDDLVWDHCLGSEIEVLSYDIDEEKYFIDQKIEILSDSGDINSIFSLDYFKEVLSEEHINKPIIAVFGGAGVGKTTLCDQLVNLIDSYHKKKSIYISSSDITNDISDLEVKSISDLYRLSNVESSDENRNLLDPSNLEINISCGNIIVVIDGLDEIESKLKERFSFEDFISNLISLNESYQNCTIVVTNRDYYKDQYEFNPYIEILSLYGFDQHLSSNYFSKRLSQELQPKALTQLRELQTSHGEFYAPITLSLICDIIESEKEIEGLSQLPSSSEYLNSGQTLDRLIVKLVEREIKRQSLNMSVDDVIEILTEIAIIHKGSIEKSELNILLELYDPDLNIDSYSAFYVNPLLKTKAHEDYVKIRYDITHLLLKSRYFIYCVSNNKIDFNFLTKILIEFYDGHSELLNEITNHTNISIETAEVFTKSVITILQEQYTHSVSEGNHKTVEISKKLISAILYFFFTLFQNLDKTDRAEYLKRIYSGRITYLFIFGDFFPLDFRNLTIEDSGFFKFQNFEKSIFPTDKTVFYSTSFKGIVPKANIDAKNSLFDNSCSVNNSLKFAVNKSEGDKEHILNLVKSDMILIFGLLFKNRSFMSKSENIFKNKKNKLHSKISMKQYIDFFLGNDIFTKEKSYSSRSKYHYSLTDTYKDDIRYLLTNNNLTPKFEVVFKRIVENFYGINF